MERPLVEVLAFEGCPHGPPALDLVNAVLGELGVTADVRVVQVGDPDAAATHRFLGSPTIRVNGRDIEPGADERSDYARSCRIYRTASGCLSGEPDARWLRTALAAST